MDCSDGGVVEARRGERELQGVPRPALLWRSLRLWVWVGVALLALKAVPHLIVDFWFLDSLGRAAIFWTNFGAQAALFATAAIAFAAAVGLPLRRYARSAGLRRAAVHLALWTGIVAGWLLARRYLVYLLATAAVGFGETDPVFGHDVGLYVFLLPALRTTLEAATWCGLAGALAALVGGYDRLAAEGVLGRRDLSPGTKLAGLVSHGLNLALLLVGASLVSRTFLRRYQLLFANNEEAGVRLGAAYVDVGGFVSTLNLINLSTLVELGIMVVVGYGLYRVARAGSGDVGGLPVRGAPATSAELPGGGGALDDESGGESNGEPTGAAGIRGTGAAGIPAGVAPVRLRPLAAAVVALLALELLFYLAVVVRQHVFVSPNEPNVQVPYIRRHMDATLRAHRLDRIETVAWRPPERPLTADQLLASKTLRSAPLLPTWVSYLEEPPDIQHYERVTISDSTMVYGPLLQIYEQQQQLRPYYRFLSVDGVRYTVGGEKRMYASAVRELPSRALVGAQEWLRYWGSAALMYTHGFGIVMSPVNELDSEGGAVYALKDVPPHAREPLFEHEPRIYFGEGAKDDYILTGVRHLKEFDHATRQSRSEFTYPPEATDGIRVDSPWRRLVLALRTGDVPAFLFSRFIDHERTRVHLYRTPIERVRRIAPFLFLDSNVYAFVADGDVLWMVNGLTTSANYPYSFREVLGDKADERAVEEFPERVVNYVEDSVKVTVDAFSGDVRLYRISDDPVVRAWARVYPELFEPAAAMPESVRAQLTYPLQWFHLQFDDIYKRYHQRDPIEFYNVEDLWDDADEVVGSIGRGLSEFGTGDQMTFSYEGYNLLLDPADLPADAAVGTPGELEYALMMPFTPEAARNLRSLVIALQDPGSYGRLLNLRVPQGAFVPGPEQADAMIDNDSQVNQQITLWVRHGSEVVRGHTLLVPVAGDVAYVEPLWIMSLQNQLPQIKLFSVVYRGRTTMSTSLEDAVGLLAVPESEEQRANELPWFREAPGVGSPGRQ